MAQINFENITLAFANNIIVENFNLHIKEGEIVTFFGPSGCGKSSIMKLVLGINIPTNGNVKIGNIEASQYKIPISYVPQDNELLPWLSVKGNIELWAKNTPSSNLTSKEVLEMVDLYTHSDKLPASLSGGMARRTVLARALAIKSKILCFDETMVGIEKTLRYTLLNKLRDYIKKIEATAIFISHDYEETIFLSDKIILFSPPPTSVLKIIDVANITNGADRNYTFLSSAIFKEIYNNILN